MTPEVRVDLVPHAESLPRSTWPHESQIDRPLSTRGCGEAESLAPRLSDAAAVFSSPALRCRQTVTPLASALGFEVQPVDELYELVNLSEPREWVTGFYSPIAAALGGSWGAGRAYRGLLAMTAGGHERVVACTHGDVIALLVGMLCAWHDVPVPAVVERGGWVRLRLGAGFAAHTHPPGVGDDEGALRLDDAV